MRIISALILCFSTILPSQISGKCVQRSFTSTDLRVCASKCISQTVQFCVDGESFIGDVTSITFQGPKIPHLRRGILKDLPHLTWVDFLNQGVKRLSPQAFLNTPKIQHVDFTFSEIEEIPWGVFNDMSFEELIFSWNKISFIEEEAFSNMPNLTRLILQRNNIQTFDRDWFKNSNSLKVLNLSFNNINKIHPFSFVSFPRLEVLDLSFNHILELGSLSFVKGQSLDVLDLTGNNMTAMSVSIFPQQGFSVKKLSVALNKISFLSEDLLGRGNVSVLVLSPNPWQCPCLDRVLDWVYKNNRTVQDPNDDFRIFLDSRLPVCAFKVKNPSDCVLGYDEDFLNTQNKYFEYVYYPSALRQKPILERPNFDVLQVDHSRDNLTPL